MADNGGDFSRNVLASKLPAGVILVKGAWSSASDSLTPVPENGVFTASGYANAYFSLTWPLRPGWIQKYAGPPPSDSGYYVLAQLRPASDAEVSQQGTVLIAAQDQFFSLSGAQDALELLRYSRRRLSAEYRIEREPGQIDLGGRSFARMDYASPAAGLYWSVLATSSRCHLLQFMLTASSERARRSLLAQFETLRWPQPSAEGPGDSPLCLAHYARGPQLLESVEPVFTERRFNPIPVRIVIDESGRVAHVHLLSAFPDQALAVNAALSHWRFKPYAVGGRAVKVETGIIFGRAPQRPAVTAEHDAGT